MDKQIQDISITLFGPTLKESSYANVRYTVVLPEDVRFRASVQKDMWDDEKIKKHIAALWERCVALLAKAEA